MSPVLIFLLGMTIGLTLGVVLMAMVASAREDAAGLDEAFAALYRKWEIEDAASSWCPHVRRGPYDWEQE